MNRSESIAKIATALVKAQSEMGNAVKGASNPFFKSKFADLNSIREAALPVLNKHGVGVFQPTVVIEGKLYVETTLLHESGEYISGTYEVVTGKANDPQALGAAVSYSRRYSLQSMVNIGAEDDDAESAMGRNTKAAPPKTVTPANAATTDTTVKTAATAVVVEEPKKGGFGVKKVETVTTTTSGSEDGWS